MSKNIKNPLALAALAIFASHPELKEITVASDGQGFTDQEKLRNHLSYLKDKNTETFERGFEENYVEEDDQIDEAAAERNALVSEYKELFGEEPKHNAKTETIQKKIDEKKAELTAAAKSEDNATGDDKGNEESGDQK